MAVRKHSQSRVLPSAKLAYETGLSAGSIAMLAHGHPGTRPPKWSPLSELHPPPLGATAGQAELARVPSEHITDNVLGAFETVGARRLAPDFVPSFGGASVQGCLILSQVGLLFPVNHAPMKLASLIRLRSEATADGTGLRNGGSLNLLVTALIPEMPIRKRATRSALEILLEHLGLFN